MIHRPRLVMHIRVHSWLHCTRSCFLTHLYNYFQCTRSCFRTRLYSYLQCTRSVRLNRGLCYDDQFDYFYFYLMHSKHILNTCNWKVDNTICITQFYCCVHDTHRSVHSISITHWSLQMYTFQAKHNWVNNTLEEAECAQTVACSMPKSRTTWASPGGCCAFSVCCLTTHQAEDALRCTAHWTLSKSTDQRENYSVTPNIHYA